YLNAVINETLRLAPPLSSVQRVSVEDYKLGNTVPKGTTLEFQPYVLHRDPLNFDDPEQFIPERFVNPTHHPYAFVPFGGGPRLCIGQRFALNEMRMCIAKLIHKYEFTTAPGFKLDYFTGNFLLTPKQVLVNIKRRYLRRRYTYWSRHGVKGHNYVDFWEFFTKFTDNVMVGYQKFGRIYGYYFFMSKWIVVNEPQLIRDIV
ncbi:unnamed protein product, partial [Oppiella nova]